MTRVYIAGPMTGLPGLNFDTFHARATLLRNAGYQVENPAEINADTAAKWVDCMRADIARLVLCDAVYVLPGWGASRGASLEVHIARALGMPVVISMEELSGAMETIALCEGVVGAAT